MKRYFAFALTVWLMGCQQDGSSNGGGGGKPNPPGPIPGGEIPWGDLSCQKSGSCDDPVLNKPWVDLIHFFELNFVKPQPKGAEDTREQLIFRCGIKTQKTWMQVFHVPSDSTEGIAISRSEFFDGTLAWETCTYADSLEEKIKTYFMNTKEYKNESK